MDEEISLNIAESNEVRAKETVRETHEVLAKFDRCKARVEAVLTFKERLFRFFCIGSKPSGLSSPRKASEADSGDRHRRSRRDPDHHYGSRHASHSQRRDKRREPAQTSSRPQKSTYIQHGPILSSQESTRDRETDRQTRHVYVPGTSSALTSTRKSQAKSTTPFEQHRAFCGEMKTSKSAANTKSSEVDTRDTTGKPYTPISGYEPQYSVIVRPITGDSQSDSSQSNSVHEDPKEETIDEPRRRRRRRRRRGE